MSKRVYCEEPDNDEGSNISMPSTKTIRVDESVVKQSEDKCIQVDEIFCTDLEEIDSVAGEITNLLVRQVSELADRFQLAPNPKNAGNTSQIDGPSSSSSQSSSSSSPSSSSSSTSSSSSSSDVIPRRRGCLKKTTPREKRKVLFDLVTVLYFERSQGFTCVPSMGGSTLGMQRCHYSKKTFTLETHAEERKRVHREILIRRKKFEKTQRETFSETESESDNNSEFSDIDLENDSVYFLQPVPVKERRALLRASGVTKIDPSEKEECRDIRISREFCGCDCETYCNPKTCACSLAGIQCQVDRLSFPCGCTKDQCQNQNGRIEFNPMRVKSHFVNTILRLNRENKEQCSILRGDTVDGVCESAQLSYHSMVHQSSMRDNHQALQYMQQHQQTSAQQHANGSQYIVSDNVLENGYGPAAGMFTNNGYSPSTSTYSDESEYTNSSDFDADPDLVGTVTVPNTTNPNTTINDKNHCSTMVMNNGMFHQNGYGSHVSAAVLPSFTSINGHSYPNHTHMQNQFYGQYSNGHQQQQQQQQQAAQQQQHSGTPSTAHQTESASLYYANHYAFQSADKCDAYTMNMSHVNHSAQDSRSLTADAAFMPVHVNGSADHHQQQYTDLSVANGVMGTHSLKKDYTEQAFIQQQQQQQQQQAATNEQLCYGSIDNNRNTNGCGPVSSPYQAYSTISMEHQHQQVTQQLQAQQSQSQQQLTNSSLSTIHANDSYVPNENGRIYTQNHKDCPTESHHRSSTEGIVESVSA